jgi:hypothetical protein
MQFFKEIIRNGILRIPVVYSSVYLRPVFRIGDILVPCGSGSAEAYLWLGRIRIRILLFSSVTFKMATKKLFCLLPVLFEATFTSFFKDKKS